MNNQKDNKSQIIDVLKQGISYENAAEKNPLISGLNYMPASRDAYSKLITILETNETLSKKNITEIIDIVNNIFNQPFYPGIVLFFTLEKLHLWIKTFNYEHKPILWREQIAARQYGITLQEYITMKNNKRK